MNVASPVADPAVAASRSASAPPPHVDAVTCVQQLYEAFGRGDVEAIVARLAPGFTWRFVGDRAAPYTGRFDTPVDVRRFFAAVATAERIEAFEPREMLAQGEHVTVLGWERCLPHGGQPFESDWVHVFTVRDGRIARFFGLFDTQAAAAARAY